MGWLFEGTPRSKHDYIESLLSEHYPQGGSTFLLDRSVVGNHLWLLLKPECLQPVIVLYLLSKSQGCWGYKDMDESMGPYVFDCPLRFFSHAPEPEGFNKNLRGEGHSWREQVIAYHELRKLRKSQRPRIGDRISLSDDQFPGYAGIYTVTKDLGRKGLLLDDFLRMNMQQIKHAKVIPGWGQSA